MAPCIDITFEESKSAVALTTDRIIESALKTLKARSSEAFYCRKAWSVVHCFLVATINTEDDKKVINFLFTHAGYTILRFLLLV